MEMRARLIRFHEPVIANRSSDLALLRMRVRDSGTATFVQHFPRVEPGWQDYYIDFSAPSGVGTLTFFLMLKTNFEEIDIAVDFVRVYQLKS